MRNIFFTRLVLGVILVFVALSFYVSSVYAAAGINQTINFQGKLVDDEGLNVANGNYDVIFKLYDASSGGTELWTETWNSGTSQVNVQDGVFRVALGTYSSMASVNFNQDTIYLSVKVGADAEMTPRIRFTSVPYAFVAKTTVDDALDFAQFEDALDLDASTSITADGAEYLSIVNTGTGYSLLVEDQLTDTTPFVIDAAGNVGIGTTAPASSLEVVGNAQITGGDLYITRNAQAFNSSNETITSLSAGFLDFLARGNISFYIDTNANGNNSFDVFANGSSTKVFTILDTGSVGIGITSPTGALQVVGDEVRIGSAGTVNSAVDAGDLFVQNDLEVDSLAGTGTRAVYSDTNGLLTNTAPTSGSIGYWSRTGITLSPTTANDTVSVANTTTSGADLAITNTGVYTGTGIFNLTANSATTGTLANISGTALTSGNGLIIQGPTSGSALTGNLLQINTASTGAAANGFVRFNFSGAHTGNGVQIDDAAATGTALALNTNSLTTGDALNITSTSTALTSGSLADLYWNPSGSTEIYSTGDVFKINVGQYANPTNIFAIYDNGTELFSIDQAKITSALPHEFTAAGDVSMSYDLIMTNTTASYIKFEGPGYVQTSHPSGSYDLTLSAANAGSVVIADNLLPGADDTYDLGSTSLRWKDLYVGGETIHIGSTITDEATISYTAGNILAFGTDSTTNGDISFFTDDLYLDKSTGFVGIGTTNPLNVLYTLSSSNTNGPRFDINSTYTNVNGIGNLILNNNSATVNSFSGITFGNNDSLGNRFTTATIEAIATNVTDGTEAGSLRFITRTDGSNITEKMRITSSGNVGIGTTNPVYQLDATGVGSFAGGLRVDASTNTAFDALYFRNSSNGTSALSRFSLRNDTGETAIIDNFSSTYSAAIDGINLAGMFRIIARTPATSFMLGTESTGDPLYFVTGNTIRQTITGSGNVGIGTTTTSGRLHVNSGASSETALVLQNGVNANYPDIYCKNNAGSNTLCEFKSGIYNNGATFYNQNALVQRSPISNDQAPYLQIDGGTSGYSYFSGNVGIGTTNPNYTLSVVGNGDISTTLNVNGGSSSNWASLNIGGALSINANGSIYSYNSVCVGNYGGDCNSIGGTVIGKTNTSASINITHTANSFFNTGNVGIGTTAPAAKLQVVSDFTNGSASNISSNVTQTVNTNGTYYNIGSGVYSTAVISSGITNSGYLVGVDAGVLRSSAADVGTLSALTGQRIQFGHYSGSATTRSTTNAYGLLVEPYYMNGTINNIYELYLSGGTGGGTATNKWGIYQDSSAFNNYFAGNVGIGTTNPNYRLSVVGNGDISTTLNVNGGSSSNWASLNIGGALSINANGSIYSYNSVCVGNYGGDCNSIGGTVIGKTNTSASINITHTANSFFNTGNVGIGTTAPSQKLEVNGRIRMNTWIADGDAVAYQDTATNSIALATSDRRLKKDIVPLSGALDIINQVGVYKYHDLDDASDARLRIGMMSQELLPIMPELTFKFTKEGSDESYYGIHYDKMSALAVLGIKEQQLQINDLKVSDQTTVNSLSVQAMDIAELDQAITQFASNQQVANLSALVDTLTSKVTTLETKTAATDIKVASMEAKLNTLILDNGGLPVELSNLTDLSSLISITSTPVGTMEVTIDADFIVLGRVVADEVNIRNNASVGSVIIDGSNSAINSIIGPLRLQNSLTAEDIEMFAGQIVMTNTGDIKAKGAVTSKQFVIDISDVAGVATSSATLEASGSASLVASSSGKLVHKSVGDETIPAGTIEIRIENTLVKTNSKIFITPTSDTGGQPLVISSKEDGAFTVRISNILSTDITFDYFIIGVSQ